MNQRVALALLTTAVLNVPSVLVLFRMTGGLDDIKPRTRRLTVTVGTLTLLLLIASGATSAYWLIDSVIGSRVVAAATAFSVFGVLPFLFVEEILYQGYVDQLEDNV